MLGLFQGGPGRGVLLSTGAFRGNRDRLQFPELAENPTPIVNMIQLGQALTVRRPPVRALFVYNANPLSACPDGRTVRRGLDRDDLFTVVHDQVMTPTALHVECDGVAHRFARASDGRVVAPVPAAVTELRVREGDTVQAGDRLLTLEVMKMD